MALPTTLWQPFSVALDASGNGSETLGAPTLGTNWQAYVVLSEAPSGQTFRVSVSGVVVAHGGSQCSTFAAGSGQTVQITVTGGTANSTLHGVLQGTILAGNSPSSPESSTGSLVQISGGSIDVTAADVTITAGQNGVNVSTDAPPVAGTTITIPAGSDTVTDTLHPPANATAIGFAFQPIATYTLQVTVKDALTLVELENFSFPAANTSDIGRSFTIPLTPGMTESGIIVTATAGGTLAVATNVGYTLWYIGTNSIQPVNYPTQPLYVQGQGAEGIDATSPYTQAANLDAVVVGNGAETLNEKSSNAIPIDMVVQGINASGNGKVGISGLVDQIVQGNQGSGASVQTVRQAPQLNVVVNSTLAAGGSVTLIAAVSGQSIRLRHVQLQTTASEQIVLRSVASGGTLYWVGNPGTGGTTPDLDFEGFALAVDTALVLQNVGSGAVTVTGRVTADQY